MENELVIKPRYTLSEELMSAISHGIGVLLAIAGMVLCIVKSEWFISGGKQTFSGVVGQQRVDKDYVYNYCIPIPPLKEQETQAGYLCSYH